MSRGRLALRIINWKNWVVFKPLLGNSNRGGGGVCHGTNNCIERIMWQHVPPRFSVFGQVIACVKGEWWWRFFFLWLRGRGACALMERTVEIGGCASTRGLPVCLLPACLPACPPCSLRSLACTVAVKGVNPFLV